MSDPFPGDPVTQGQWKTVEGQLIWLGRDRVLEVRGGGRYRLWRYDPASTGDPLPGDPLCDGTWASIGTSHELVYLGGDRVLDVETGRWDYMPFRIWHFDRSVQGGDPFPGNPVVEGSWKNTHLWPLIYLGSDRVMYFDAPSGGYQVFRYDRTVTGSGDPFVPITSGQWQTISGSSHVLTSLDGGRVLETYLEMPRSGDQYRLWRFDPEATGDPFPGSPIASGTWQTVYPPLTYLGGNKVLQANPVPPPPIDYKVWNYARDCLLVPGRSESWQIEAGADDSVWAVGDAGHLYRWDGAQWVQPTSYARGVQVTVGDCDHIWHLNSIGQVWHYVGNGAWQQDTQITALSVAAAADFTVWAISSTGRVMRRDGTVGATWSEPTPYARGVQIAVGRKDLVWHRNSIGEIWSWTGSGWTQIPGTALDIAVAGDGTACRVSPDNRLYRWVGGQWLELPTDGRVAQVSVGGANNIWYVSLDNHIFSWNGTQFGQRTTLPV